MKPPYLWRIVAWMADGEPIEIYRSQEGYNQKTWDFWVRGMDQAWDVRMEQTLGNRHTVTPRVRIKDHYANPTNYKFHLSYEEKVEAGVGADL